MLCRIDYKRSKNSEYYQTSGSMTVSQEDLEAAVEDLTSKDYEVVTITWNVTP